MGVTGMEEGMGVTGMEGGGCVGFDRDDFAAAIGEKERKGVARAKEMKGLVWYGGGEV